MLITPAAALARMNIVDVAGLSLWLTGFAIEAVADHQKSAWAAKVGSEGRKTQFIDVGLWSVSRHPNYFGEILLWIGTAITCASAFRHSPLRAASFAVSPLLVTGLLTKVSGIPMLEKSSDKRYGHLASYKAYKQQLDNIAGDAASKSNLRKADSSSLAASKTSISSRSQSIKNVKGSAASIASGNEAPTPPSPKSQPTVPSNPSVATIKAPSGPGSDYYHSRELTGIFPLFLTTASQAIAKVTIDVDVSEERMFRMVPKSDLMQDMATRLAISDFTPAKAQILAYPREELMLHYDPEYRYTQNFFLVIDAATVDSIVNPPEEKNDEADDAAGADSKKDRERGWKSLGSEKEIEMEWVKNLDEPIKVQVSRRYGEFNAPYSFGDRDASEAFVEIKSYKDPNFDIYRMEIQVGVQAVPELASSHAQTAWFRPVNFACQYEALEMDGAEKHEIQHSDAMEDFFLGVSSRFEEYLQHNEVMNIFENDYQNLGEEEMALDQGVHTILQEYQSFTDLINSKDKCISCIDWHPTQKGVLAISCTQAMGLDDRILHGFTVKAKKSVIIIWSFHDPIHPQLILEAPEDVTCFQIHPEDPSIVVAGCMNGQIVLWDISDFQEMLQSSRKTETEAGDRNGEGEQSSAPCVRFAVVSSIESSHRGPVSDVHWLPKHFEIANNGDIVDAAENGDKQLVTSSLDGTVAFWDLRFKKDWKSLDLAWRPFIRVPISAMDNSFDYSVTRVSLQTVLNDEVAKAAKPANPPADGEAPKRPNIKNWTSKFYCSTEEGDLVYADWIAEKVTEEKSSRVEFASNIHFGPVCDLERSPFFPDIFLSAGGWTIHIWREKFHAGPLLSSAQSTSTVTCAKWSPSRPAVFYIGRSDGVLEVWDLLDKTHSATTVQTVATSAISSINIRQYPGKSAQQFIAVGDDAGTLHILETPRNLQKITKNEKHVIQTYFDRETKRLGISSDRKKAHIKARPAFEASQLEQIAAAAKLAQQRADEAAADKPMESESDIAEGKEEKQYLDMEKALLEALLPPAAE
ncbi:WD repeat-containing protein 63 [Kappamyces sp. JEL0829]|nr:WD repeat-containing protein 63 [Kappamyces sp. JEL0829]